MKLRALPTFVALLVMGLLAIHAAEPWMTNVRASLGLAASDAIFGWLPAHIAWYIGWVGACAMTGHLLLACTWGRRR